MAEVYATGFLTRVVDPGRLRSGRIVLDHLFWRILCQIRNIKYCVGTIGQRITQARG
nr:MAG TPA: hypothetical protein [Caudoviricetes sp.]